MRRIYIDIPEIKERYLTTPQLPRCLIVNLAAVRQSVDAILKLNDGQLPDKTLQWLQALPSQEYSLQKVRNGAGRSALRNA